MPRRPRTTPQNPQPPAEFPRAADSKADAKRLLSQGYLNLALAAEHAAKVGPRHEIINPFAMADVPPGVLPETNKRTLAQDGAITARAAWAAGQRDQRTLAQDQQVINFLPSLGFANYGSAIANGYGYLGYSFLAELAQVPEYRVITETIASESTREWIEFKSTTHRDKRRLPREKAQKLERIEERFDELKVRDRFREMVEIDGFMGRSHLYLDTDDDEKPDELKQSIGDGKSALSRSKVNPNHPLKRVAAIEATWTYPTRYNSNNPLKADWYRPSAWFVMATELHVSRLLPFIGREVPDLLKPSYNFGGLSLSQMAKPYVDNWLRTRQAVADLVWSFSTNVLATDLQTLLQGGIEADAILHRVRAFNSLRTSQGTLVINKDTEDWKNVSAPLAGLAELQSATQENMSAVSKIPLVKLLGITPTGLNASSEGEIRVFYDTIASWQESKLRIPLTTVLNFVQLSLFGEVDPEIDFSFKPLWQLDEVAKAAVQQQKAATRETDIAAGEITPQEAREAIVNDPESQYAEIDLSSEAPGEFEEEFPEEGEQGDPEHPEGNPDLESQELGGPKPKTSRLATSIGSRAAEFGSPATGGFGEK